MSIYIYKISYYSNPSPQNKSSKSTISLIFLMITKSGYCCVKYLSRCIFWYLIYKEFKSPNLKSSVVKEFVILLNVSITEQWKNMIGIVQEAI